MKPLFFIFDELSNFECEIFAQKNRNRPKQAASEAHAGMDLIKIKVRDTIISLNTELSSATTQRQIEIQEKIKRLELVLTNN